MCLMMPAFSSPDLKAFPLHLRHYRSSGSAPSLPNLPRAGKVGRYRAQWARQCDLFRSASAALHKSHRLALMPASAWLQLYCFVEVCTRAGETVNLPLEPQCVRLLPRPHGLASSQFQPLFGKVCDLPKNRLPPPRSKMAGGRFGVFC